MKKNLLSLIILISGMLSASVSSAQQFIRLGAKNSGTDASFDVISLTKDSIAVYDTTNTLYGTFKNEPVYDMSLFRRTPRLIPAFTQVFDRERLIYFKPERSITINYYVNKEGFIQEVAFLLTKNTRLTSFDVEKLQRIFSMERFEGLDQSKVKDKAKSLFLVQQKVDYRRILDYNIDVVGR